MSTKIVKTLAVSGLGTLPILGGHHGFGTKAPPVNCTSFEDASKAFAVDPQPEHKPIKIKVGDNGVGAPAVGAATVVVTKTFGDGTTAASASTAGFITDVEANSIEVNGERVACWDVEFTPAGGGTTTTSL
jgi:hypothetical protein